MLIAVNTVILERYREERSSRKAGAAWRDMSNEATTVSTPTRERTIPAAVKIAYTAFMAVLVPVYWYHYGPTNFLYFCDIALFLALFAVWRNNALAASAAAVGIMIPQLFWCVDFAVELTGNHLSQMTSYMLDERRPLFLRSLSLFHGWLPFLLLYLVHRLGYDRRGLFAWTGMAWTACLIAFFFLPPAGAVVPDVNTPLNVNYVYGIDDAKPQEWMSAPSYLISWMIGLLVCFFIPTHFALARAFKPARVSSNSQ